MVAITPTTNFNFAYTEKPLTTGSLFLHSSPRTGTLNDTDPFPNSAPSYNPLAGGIVFTNVPNPVNLPFKPVSFLIGSPNSVVYSNSTGLTTGPVAVNLQVEDRQLDFLQQGQVLNQVIKVTVKDVVHGDSTVVTINYQATGANDAPQANTDLITLNGYFNTLKYLVTGNDKDPDTGGPSVADEQVVITAAGTAVASVVSSFAPYLSTADVSIQRVNYNDPTKKESNR